MNSDYKLSVVLSADSSNFSKHLEEARKAIDGLGKTSTSNEKKVVGLFDSFTMGNLKAKAITTAFNSITGSLGNAIDRFDTLQRFPKTMDLLGFSTGSVSRSMDQLREGIQGLPTSLDQVVSTAQGLALMNGDLSKSTKLTLALNNAFLASGASAGDASRGLVQFQQMMSAGKVDMQSWKVLLETMPYGLQKVAEGFGFAGKSAKNDLYAALQSGKLTFDDFSGKLMELNEGIDGFGTLALKNSEGIKTSFANIRAAVTTGVANIITKLNEMSIAFNGKSIAQNLDSLKVIVQKTFSAVVSGIEMTRPLFEMAGKGFKFIGDNANWTIPIITGFIAAYAGMKIVKAINSDISETDGIFLRLGKNMIKGVASMKATVAGISFMQGATTLASLGLGTLKAAALGAWTAIGGPVGLAVAGAVAALTGLWKWVTSTSKEMQELKSKAETTASGVKNLSNGIGESKDKFSAGTKEIESYGINMGNLADRIEELASKEKLTKGETEELKSSIAELNGYLGDTVVHYDEQTGSLNATAEAMKKYIGAAQEEAKLEAIKERIKEVEKQKLDIQLESAKISEQLVEAEKKLAGSWQTMTGDGKLAKETVNSLKESKENLKTASEELATEEKMLGEMLKTSYNDVAYAKDQANQMQIESIKTLSEEEKRIIDDMNARYEDLVKKAQSLTEELKASTDVSMEEMLRIAENNSSVLSDYSSNMEIVFGKLVDISQKTGKDIPQSLIDQIQAGTPDAIAMAKALVSGNETEIIKLIDIMNGASDKAMNAASASIRGKTPEVQSATKGMVSNLKTEVDKLPDGTLKNGADMVQGITKGINSEKGSATSAVGQVRDESKKEFAEVYTSFMKDGTSISTGIMNGVRTNMRKPVGAIQETMQEMKAKAESIVPSFRIIGSQMMSGLASGISSNSSAVYNAAYNAASRAANAARSALQIHSPSRVFREIGEYTGEGMVLGIESSEKSVQRAMASMVDTSELSKGFNESINAISNIQNGKFEANYKESVEINGQSINLHLEMLGKSFRAFVDDITKVQDSKVQLELGYLGG